MPALKTQLPASVPVLAILEAASPACRLACLDAGVDAYLLRPFAPRELVMQVRALLRPSQLDERLRERTAELHQTHQRLQQAYRQESQELEVARRLERSILLQSLPPIPRLRLAVYHRPCGRPGGDSYDIIHHGDNVHLYLADTMAHGVTASLLTFFLKDFLRPSAEAMPSLDPGAALKSLNAALLSHELPETPFVALTCVLVNVREGTLRLARAGQPAPLYLPFDGVAELWPGGSSFLGVYATDYSTQVRHLRSGDRVVFCSDGLRPTTDGASNEGPLLACAEKHRSRPLGELVEQLARDLVDPSAVEDVTVLGLEMR